MFKLYSALSVWAALGGLGGFSLNKNRIAKNIANVTLKMIQDNLKRPDAGSSLVIMCGGKTNPIAIPI